MTAEHIVHFPRGDTPENHVLLHVTHRGPDPLDLKIEATEGENAYFLRLKHAQVPSLRSDRNPLPASDWEAVLKHVLLHEPLPESIALQDLSTSASPSSKALDLTIRTSTAGITTRLGAISLLLTEKEIDVIRWTHVSATHAATLSRSLQSAEALIASQRNQIRDLEAQLENLIASKRETEDALLAKFATAVNTKKLKIRDQQRLLATAKVDPKVAAEVRALRDAVPKGIGDARPERRRRGAAGAGRSIGGGKGTAKRKGRPASPSPSPSLPSPETRDEPLVSDDTTEEEEGDLESEREGVRQLTPTPDGSEASEADVARSSLPTRSSVPRAKTASADPLIAGEVEKEDVHMQEPVAPTRGAGATGGTQDQGKAVGGVQAVAGEGEGKDGGGGGDYDGDGDDKGDDDDDDATDEDDDDEL